MSQSKPLPMRVGAVAFAVLFLTALVPPSALADHRFAGTAFVEVRAEENQVAVFDEKGNSKSVTTTGKIIANNTEDKELQNVRIDIGNLSTTNLTSPIFANLPPRKESVVATYSVNAQPRLVLSEEWKSITYQEKIEELRSQGKISDATASRHLADLKRLFFGVPNTLEFTITVENRHSGAVENATLDDPLPDALQGPALVEARDNAAQASLPIAYDAILDRVPIPRLGPGASISLAFRGTVPAVTEPLLDFLDLSKNTTATYEIRVEAAQPFAPPVSPEVQETLDSLSNVFNSTTRDRAALAALTPGLAPAAEALDSAAAARNTVQMDAQLPQVRGQLEAAAGALANLSGSVTREGKLLARLLELLNVSVPQGEVQTRVNQIASQGLPPELQAILQAEGFTTADISQLRQFIAGNAALLGGMNLSEAYAFAGEKHFEAAHGYGLASFKGLENAVFVNKALGRTKSPFERVEVSDLRPFNCPFTVPSTGEEVKCQSSIAPFEPPTLLSRVKEGGGFSYNLVSASLSGSNPKDFDLSIHVRVTRLSDGQVVLDKQAATKVQNNVVTPVDVGQFDGLRLRWTNWDGFFPFPGVPAFPPFPASPPRPGVLTAPVFQVIAAADPDLAAMNDQATALRADLSATAAGATPSTDFAGVQDRASELTDLSFQLASRSGQFNFADLYSSSHNAKLAALRGLSGDPEGAARALRNVTFSPHLVAWKVPPDSFIALQEAGVDLNLTVGVASWRGEAAGGKIEVEVLNETGLVDTARCDFDVPASDGPTPVEEQLHGCAVSGSLLNSSGLYTLRVWLAPESEPRQAVENGQVIVRVAIPHDSLRFLPIKVEFPVFFREDRLVNSVSSYFSRSDQSFTEQYALKARVLGKTGSLLATSDAVTTVLPPDTNQGVPGDLTRVTFSFSSPLRIDSLTTFFIEFLDETSPAFAGDSGIQVLGGCPSSYGGITFDRILDGFSFDRILDGVPLFRSEPLSNCFRFDFSTSAVPPGPTPSPTPTPTPTPTSAPTPTPQPTAKVSFTSTPSGADVRAFLDLPPFDDGQRLGTTPFTFDFGGRQCSGCAVEFKLSGFLPTVKVFDFRPGQTTSVHAGLAVAPPNPGDVGGDAGDVRLKRFSDCLVTVDGVSNLLRGSLCSFTVHGIAAGTQPFSIQRAGYQPIAGTIPVVAGQTVFIGGPGVINPALNDQKFHTSSASGQMLTALGGLRLFEWILSQLFGDRKCDKFSMLIQAISNRVEDTELTGVVKALCTEGHPALITLNTNIKVGFDQAPATIDFGLFKRFVNSLPFDGLGATKTLNIAIGDTSAQCVFPPSDEIETCNNKNFVSNTVPNHGRTNIVISISGVTGSASTLWKVEKAPKEEFFFASRIASQQVMGGWLAVPLFFD